MEYFLCRNCGSVVDMSIENRGRRYVMCPKCGGMAHIHRKKSTD